MGLTWYLHSQAFDRGNANGKSGLSNWNFSLKAVDDKTNPMCAGRPARSRG